MAKCLDCGSKINLQKHHTSYEPPKIISLCVTCHKKRHNNLHGVGASSWSYTYPIGNTFIKILTKDQRIRIPLSIRRTQGIERTDIIRVKIEKINN